MKFFKKITLFTIIFFVFQANLLADVPYYLDFKYILNQSEAGKKAQINLKNKLDSGIKKLKAKEKAIQEEEKNIIKQKKLSLLKNIKRK